MKQLNSLGSYMFKVAAEVLAVSLTLVSGSYQWYMVPRHILIPRTAAITTLSLL